MSHVCAFRQALALDELRVKFLPEYANGGAGSYAQNVKEVWFSGFHSDMYAPQSNVRPCVLINSSAVAGTFPI
jgi:hypothetical protein